MNENEWTDKQKEEYQRLTDEYYTHPICGKCGKPIDKDTIKVHRVPIGASKFSTGYGVGMEICCADCGPIYRCDWGDLVIAIDALHGEPIQKKIDNMWLSYADLLAKKAHPDWWDFEKMLPVRKEDTDEGN